MEDGIEIRGIHIQSLDMFGSRVGFVKFVVRALAECGL
jgi:hypothetical protein